MQWHELQSQFIDSLRNPDLGLPDGLGTVCGSLQTKRFNVYRNNVAVSLADNLAASYPVTQQLVGEEFFVGMARVFADSNAPTSPVMLGYGAEFPEFISRFEPAQGLPFLADVARIERDWNGAYNAADAHPIGIEALQSIAPDALEATIIHLHPSLRIIRSDWPALSIWHLHQTSDNPAAAMQDLTPEPESGVIVRPSLDVDVRLIPDLAAVFYTALADGRSLGVAAELLADAQSNDMGAMLQLLFTCGAVCAVEPPAGYQP
ncbi:MAG: putative DNA-binding domain-containing protein [Pseudomonadota bacterium]